MVFVENDAVSSVRPCLLDSSPIFCFDRGLFPLMILSDIDVVPFGADEDVSKVERPGDGVSHHEEV